VGGLREQKQKKMNYWEKYIIKKIFTSRIISDCCIRGDVRLVALVEDASS